MRAVVGLPSNHRVSRSKRMVCGAIICTLPRRIAGFTPAAMASGDAKCTRSLSRTATASSVDQFGRKTSSGRDDRRRQIHRRSMAIQLNGGGLQRHVKRRFLLRASTLNELHTNSVRCGLQREAQRRRRGIACTGRRTNNEEKDIRGLGSKMQTPKRIVTQVRLPKDERSAGPRCARSAPRPTKHQRCSGFRPRESGRARHSSWRVPTLEARAAAPETRQGGSRAQREQGVTRAIRRSG